MNRVALGLESAPQVALCAGFDRSGRETQAPFLPFAKPAIGEEEIAAVVATMRSGWLTTGAETKSFEAEFCTFTGMPEAIAVNSATAGLHLALEAIGVGPGDCVFTTDFTFTATAEVVRYLGAEPVLVDIDPRTLNIDTEKLAAAVRANPRGKAVVPVHFGGFACAMQAILDIAERAGIAVVEDAAHALPATHVGRMIGTWGDITVFSFYANKTITTGEGGMVVTKRADLARRMRTMRLHGINRDAFDRFTAARAAWQYEVVAPGFKYNLTDIASAIGRCQLRKAERFRQERARIAAAYNAAFQDLPVILPADAEEGDLHAWHLYVLQLDTDQLNFGRDAFIEQMSAAGIGTSVHYIPLHRQPYWRDRYCLRPEQFPAAEQVYSRCVSLPLWHGMSEAQVERVIGAVRSIFLAKHV